MTIYQQSKKVRRMIIFFLMPLILCASEFPLQYSREFRYGKSRGEFGIIIEKEIEPIGPCAFTVDKYGNIYIEDPINSVIKVINPGEDRIIKEIPIDGMYDDIAIDAALKIYLLDRSQSRILAVDETGKCETMLKDGKLLEEGFWLSSTPSGLFLVSEQESYNIKDEYCTNGVVSKSGMSYKTEWYNESTGILKVLDKTGKSQQEIEIKRQGLASIYFLGEDTDGNIYLQIEYIVSETEVGLEVIKLSKEGKKISTLQIPENNYYVWTSRLLFVDTFGKLYQVLPKSNCLKINIWTQTQ